MDKYLLIYSYVGEDESFTVESSSESYLKGKVSECVGLSDKSINYQIVKVICEGIEEYREEEEYIDIGNMIMGRDNDGVTISLDEVRDFIKSQRLSENQSSQQMAIFNNKNKLLENYNKFDEDTK